eukprot:Tbor_TRINITY_DN5410_c5_g1::TRINITY_DN5410_c5_g1_i1::g.25386::m.25386/K03253/EIF3B; translation initiation factor 3 subunit B
MSTDIMQKHIIVDGFPHVPKESFPKFDGFFKKKLKILLNIDEVLFKVSYFFKEDGSIDGCFIGFQKRADVDRALSLIHGYRITSTCTLSSYTWDTIKNLSQVPDEYILPEEETEQQSETDLTNNMMLDEDARPQFLVKEGGPRYDITWNWLNWKTNTIDLYRKSSVSKNDLIGQWTELDRIDSNKRSVRCAGLFPMWSPFGTYLITEQPEGIILYAGPRMQRVMLVDETEVQQIQVSPSEQYLVVKTTRDISMWSIRFAKKLRSLSNLSLSNDIWPVIAFNSDDSLCSIVKAVSGKSDEKEGSVADSLLKVYDTATMKLVRGPEIDGSKVDYSLSIKGLIEVRWSPTSKDQLAFVTTDVTTGGIRVEVGSVLYNEESIDYFTFNPLVKKNFLIAVNGSLLWHPAGTHMVAKLNIKKKASEYIEYCLFKLGRSMASAEHIKIQGNPLRFSWQPEGRYFAVTVEKEKSDKRELQIYDIQGKSACMKVATVDTSGYLLLWSPKGSHIVSFDFDRSIIELYGIDEKTNKITKYPREVHRLCNKVEWDPTGRFLASSTTYTTTNGGPGPDGKERPDGNSYQITDKNGTMVQYVKLTENKMSHLTWRPLSRPVLSDSDILDVKKNRVAFMKKYQKEENDKELQIETDKNNKIRKAEEEYIKRMDAILQDNEAHGVLEERRALIASAPSSKQDVPELKEYITEEITEEYIL